MALQVWLPLNGDINNYGLSDLKFSLVSTNTSVSSSGKIGKCYLNDSNSGGGLISDKPINLGQKLSMFCWVKMTQFTSSASLTGILGQHRYQTCQGTGITMHYTSATSGQLSINTGNGNGSRTYSTYYGNTTLVAGEWYHVGFTYDNGVWKLYVNGVLDGTFSPYINSNINDYIGVFCWSLSGTSGAGLHGDYKLRGALNDVRIYDHCLSPKEVKEISKGLVLHYKLDDPYVEATTNICRQPVYSSVIPDSYPWDSSKHQGAVSVSNWTVGYNSGVQVPATGYHACWKMIDNIPTMVMVDRNSDIGYRHRWLGISGGISGTDISSNTTYTVSFDAKSDVNDKRMASGVYYRQSSSGSYNFHDGCPEFALTTDWKRYSYTYTIKTVDNIGALYVYGHYGSLEGTVYVRNIQVELKDHATPYTPSSRTSSIVYDCSGYGYNGMIDGSLFIIDSTAKYNKSTYFKTTSDDIRMTNITLLSSLKTCTCSFWFYLDTLKRWLPCAGQDGNYWFLATESGTGSFYHNNVGSNTKTIYVDGVVSTVPKGAGGWHHYVITGLDLSTWTRLCINQYGNQGNTWNWVGKVSDFRLYNTNLSADDVKDLYQTSAAIHNTGTIEAFEFEETSRNNCLFDYTNTSLISTTGWGRSVSYNNDGYLVLTANNGWATFGWNTSSYSGKTICVDFDYRFTNLDNINGSWLSVAPSMGYYSSVRDLDISELNIWKHCRAELTANNYFMIMLRGVDETGLSVVMNVKNLSIILKDSVTSTTSINKNGIIEGSILKEDTCDTTISMEGIRGKQLIEI